MVPFAALSVAAFLNMLGVCTHIPYTDGGYADLSNVAADLKYLGISSVRDGLSEGQNGSAPFSSFVNLANNGVKFTVGTVGNTDTLGLMQQIKAINSLRHAVSGSVEAVEGLNEVNNFPSTYNQVGGLTGAVNLQLGLYKLAKTLISKDLPVLYFTGYSSGGLGNGPDPAAHNGLADYDNQHPYPRFGQPPYTWIDPKTALTNEPSHRGPFVYTETGYSTNGNGPDTVDQSTQAKYSLDLLLDAAAFGVSKVFLYQLLDGYSPQSRQGDDGFGLFDFNRKPKLAAVSIHNFTQILSDKVGAIQKIDSKDPQYTLVSMPQYGHSILLKRSDGKYFLILWNEQPIWNSSTKTEIAPLQANVTVNFSNQVSIISLFDPIVSRSAILEKTNVTTLPLSLTDRPLMIMISSK